MKKEYAEEVAAKIIEQLEQGTAPWQKPWLPGELTLPYNASTGKEYRGVNSMWLAMQGYSDPRWITYNQAANTGAQVRKGSKGTKIIYWKFREEQQIKDEQGRPITDEDGNPKTITVELEQPRSFHAVVFNAEQIDGLSALAPKQIISEPERHARTEAILSNSSANIQHIEGDRAFYRHSTDSIILPQRHQFQTTDSYYATALHELGHWTGHPTRLDRDLSNPFGSEGYAREELRAEIASLMIGERLDIGHDPGQHAAYVGSWIKVLQDDPLEIFRASSDAEKIASFVMAFEQEKEQVQEQGQHQAADKRLPHEMTLIEFIGQANVEELINHGRKWSVILGDRDFSFSDADSPQAALADVHRGSVNNALFLNTPEGAEIGIKYTMPPSVVLAEYPDLVAQYPQAAEQEQLMEKPFTAQTHAFAALGIKLPGDWNGNIQILGSIVKEVEGRENIVPAEEGVAPALWGVHVQCRDGTHVLIDNFGSRKPAEELADGLARIYESDRQKQYQPDNQIQFLVCNNNTLCYREQGITMLGILASTIGGRDVKNGPFFAGSTDELRLAEIEDFNRFHVMVPPDFVQEPDQTQPVLQEETCVLHELPENPVLSRIYLAVPFVEKEQAKAAAKVAGFHLQWDKEAKSWFAPEGADITALKKWHLDSGRVIDAATKESPVLQFSRALKEAGLIAEGLPVMDGKIHRVAVEGDKNGATSGAYAGHLEGRIPGGYIENHKTGLIINWKAEGKIDQISEAEKDLLIKESERRQQQRDIEKNEMQEATANAASALWAVSPIATADNDYCKIKGIENPEEIGLKVVPDATSPQLESHHIKIAKSVKEAKEIRDTYPDARVFKAGDLLIPGYDEAGKLWTLQSVNPSFKSLMKGGRKHGLFTVAGKAFEGKGIGELVGDFPLILVEGYATGDTVARLSDQPVVVAFDSGNLEAVASMLREKFPYRMMLVAADHDHEAPNKIGANGKPGVNAGMEKAKLVAARYGAGIAAPQFKEGEKGSDWNDIKVNRGFEASKRMLTEQLALAKREAAILSERLVGLARTREMEARNDPTTSLDDAVIAAERGKAISTIISSLEQKDQISHTTDSNLNSKNGISGIVRKSQTMQDNVTKERQARFCSSENQEKDSKEERQQSRQEPRAKSRNRDFDAGF